MLQGKHYMLIEVISQFYRCLIPVIPWLLYLYDTEHGGQVDMKLSDCPKPHLSPFEISLFPIFPLPVDRGPIK